MFSHNNTQLKIAANEKNCQFSVACLHPPASFVTDCDYCRNITTTTIYVKEKKKPSSMVTLLNKMDQ